MAPLINFHNLLFFDSEVCIHVLILESIVAIVILTEERMSQSSFDCDPLGWLQVHHLRQQVNGMRVILKVGAEFGQVLVAVHLPLWEGRLHLWQPVRALPVILVGSSQALKDLENLTNLAFAVEQGLPVCEFEEDASNRPNVYTSAVNFLAKKNLRCSIPKRDNLMCVALER